MKRTNRSATKVTVLVVGALMMIPTVSAAPTQMDAGDDPRVSGALELETDGCRRQREKFRGQVVAKGKTCLRIYTYDPDAETDDARNYGVVWLQSNLNSRRRWCGAKVLSDVELPGNITVESRAPRTLRLKRRRAYETVLTAQAGGHATTETETSVEQDQVLYPEKIRTRVLRDKNVFRLKWVGLEKAKLGFASGAEISWPAGATLDGISFRLNYSLKRGRC